MADWGPAHCGCGCRPKEATEPGCPCKECQTGPGINFHPGGRHIVRRNEELMAAGRYEDVRWIHLAKK